MTDPLRSASLLVRTALSDPDTLQQIKDNPEQTLKTLEKQVVQQMPAPIPPPDPPTKNAIWVIVVCAFALVMVGAAWVLGHGLTVELKQDATYATRGDMILTVFTTAVGFLAGLLSPSPLGRGGH